MARYIDAVNAAEIISDKLGIALSELVDVMATVPTADVREVKRGYWQNKYRSGTTIKEGVVSSCCDMWNNRKSQFCPNCGARMDGESL